MIIPYNVCDMSQEYDEFIAGLVKHHIKIANINTAVYVGGVGTEDKPTFLFIHGVGGDFHGMVPLAYELRNDANLIFVEMPSHGDSQLVKNTSLDTIANWAQKLLPSLEANGWSPDLVIAHSFGCVVASKTNFPRIWYINPPLELRLSMKLGTKLLYYMRGILKSIYDTYPFAVFRGKILLRDKNPESLSCVKWLTRSTETSSRHFLEFARINQEFISSNTPMTIPSAKFVGIISSKYDSVVRQVNRGDISCDRLVEIDSGHMSVVERPGVIADVIADRR